jgi:hypothetical protein
LELRELATDGPALTELFVGPIAASAAFVLAFWAAGHAVGIGVGLAPLAFVYLAGTAAANSVPTPGGVGAAEVALTAGLVGVGAAPDRALAAVLVFRLATFWLPSAAGVPAWIWLRRRGALTTQPRRTLVAVEVQTSDTLAIATGSHGGHRTADKPPSWLPKWRISEMPEHLIQRLGRLSTASKVLVAASMVGAAALVGTGIATAAPAHTASPAPAVKTVASPPAPAVGAPSPSRQAATEAPEPSTGPDTDNVQSGGGSQSGDQTSPDTAVDKAAESATGPDTDNIQSGDQTGPDTSGETAG